MILEFDNPKHEALLGDYDALAKKYTAKGIDNATDIIGTIDALKAAPTLADMPRAFRPHPLKGRYKGGFAVDVTRKHRVIFTPNHGDDPNFRIDNPKSITSILIAEIFIDYH
jgi:mRNA-degrading endonuclease YafQ of YafQ-DinJ toxin-antitoxin module